MALNQIVNAVAYVGSSSIADTTEGMLNDKLSHTVYVDILAAIDGTGSFVRPVRSLVDALRVSNDGNKWVISSGDYVLPFDLLKDYNLFVYGDRTQLANKGVRLIGRVEFGGQSKDCYFKNITFVDNKIAALAEAQNGSILYFNGYSGNVIFDQCNFVSADGDPVISFGIGDSCNVLFNNCKFSKKSKLITSGIGVGARVRFVGENSIIPEIELSKAGYDLILEGGECGKITHNAGKYCLMMCG